VPSECGYGDVKWGDSMRRHTVVSVRVFMAALALGCLGLCAAPTRADTVTLGATGLLEPYFPPTTLCGIAPPTPNPCYLGGTVTIDNITGAVLSSDVTASGFPTTVEPFTQVDGVGSAYDETYLGLSNSQGEGVSFSFEQTPILGSLIGFDGSILDNDLSLAGIDGLSMAIFDGRLSVVAVTAPETPSILLLIAGLLAVAAGSGARAIRSRETV
jgi:hypothetical protein